MRECRATPVEPKHPPSLRRHKTDVLPGACFGLTARVDRRWWPIGGRSLVVGRRLSALIGRETIRTARRLLDLPGGAGGLEKSLRARL